MKALPLLLAAVFSISAFSQIAPNESQLRSAVDAGGTIRFSSGGTITLTAPLHVTLNVAIDGTTNPVTLDAQGLTNIFTVASGVQLNLTNITLVNGVASSASVTTQALGGAIRNMGATVVAVNCVFSNNVARGANWELFEGGTASGGAIWQSDGSLTIKGSSFLNNRAVGGLSRSAMGETRGGAIAVDSGTLEIDGAVFSQNVAKGEGSADAPGLSSRGSAAGGAVAMKNGMLNISKSQFLSNNAIGSRDRGRGGAVMNDAAAITVSDSYFKGNGAFGGVTKVYAASGDGAALFNDTGGQMTVAHSAFEANSSHGFIYSFQPFGESVAPGRGGAIFNAGTASVVNATFYKNAAVMDYAANQSFGGAVYNEGTFGMTNVTVAANASRLPVLYSTGGIFVLKNSLLAANVGVTATNITDAGHNISATSAPLFTAASSQNNVDVRLGPIGDYGGATPTMRLLAGSPAIDAADDAAAPATDQRGRVRPYGAHADVGAFESSAPFYVVGKVLGNCPVVTVNYGTGTTQSDAGGNFRFIAPAGAITVSINAEDALFQPATFALNLNIDTDIQTVGFPIHGFGYHPSSFGFGGLAGETWRFESSTDLQTWTPVLTNSFATDSVTNLPTSTGGSAFYRSVRQ